MIFGWENMWLVGSFAACAGGGMAKPTGSGIGQIAQFFGLVWRNGLQLDGGFAK
jgi:hypothetical protein